MFSVDFKNKLNEYLVNEDRKITKSHLDSVCCIGQKEKTCMYICLSRIGFVCAKKTPIRSKLEELSKSKKMSAMSDNCEGLGNDIEKK